MTESPWIAGVKRVLRDGELFRVRIKPVTVCANFVDLHNVTDILAGEITAAATMAIRAVLRVKLFALRAELRVNWKRIFRRLFVKEPFFDPRDLFQINRRRERAGAKGGALVAFLHHAVVAVPMRVQMTFLALALQPDGWEIAETHQLARFQLFQRKFQKRFRRIKRVRATRARVWLPLHKAKMALQHDQPLAHQRNCVVAQKEAIDQIVFAANRFHLAHEPVRV